MRIMNKIIRLTMVQLFMNTGLGKIVIRVIEEIMNIWTSVGNIEKGFIVILMILPIPVIKEVYIAGRTIMIKRKQKRA